MASGVIGACWLGLFAYWLYAARSAKAAAERLDWSERRRYVFPLVLGSIFLVQTFLGHGLDRRLLPDTAAMAGAGAGIAILGCATAIWARRTLGGNWSGAVTLKQGHTLVRRGPYRWVRNPIYTGVLIMVLGTVFTTGRVGDCIGLALIVAGLWIKLKFEEGFMLRQFPLEYPIYQRQVRALVPFLF